MLPLPFSKVMSLYRVSRKNEAWGNDRFFVLYTLVNFSPLTVIPIERTNQATNRFRLPLQASHHAVFIEVLS